MTCRVNAGVVLGTRSSLLAVRLVPLLLAPLQLRARRRQHLPLPRRAGTHLLVAMIITPHPIAERSAQWCNARNGGGYTQAGVAKGLKVPCLFMITEVSIRCQKNPGGWYTPYTRTHATCTCYHQCTTHTHTHTPFNGHLSGTTRVSRYQKGKTNLDFTEARDSEWQWHQLGHVQVCTALQTDNHARQHPTTQFLQACRPTNSVKAPKATFCCTNTNTNCLFCMAVLTYLENLQVHCDDNHCAPDREAQ